MSMFRVLQVVAIVAPRCLANWMAIVPTPPDPAWMKTFWPDLTFARSTSACHGVFRQNIRPAPGAGAGEITVDAPNARFPDLRDFLEQPIGDLCRGIIGINQHRKAWGSWFSRHQELPFTRFTRFPSRHDSGVIGNPESGMCAKAAIRRSIVAALACWSKTRP